MVRSGRDQKMARTTKVVADASVVVKWYNREEYSRDALKLRADYASGVVDLAAPYLLIYEMANALRYNPNFGAEDLKSAVKDLLDLGIDLMLLEEDQIKRISDIAFKHGITSYDAAYVAAAEAGDVLMYTADEKLLRSIRGSRVRHIRDYGMV